MGKCKRHILFEFLMFIFSLHLFARSVYYGENFVLKARVMYKKGDVHYIESELELTQGDLKVFADKGIYDSRVKIMEAFGNITAYYQDAKLTCGYLMYYLNEERGIARDKPVVIKKRYLENNKDFNLVYMKAYEIEFFRLERMLRAKGNVIVVEVPRSVRQEDAWSYKKFFNKIECDELEVYLNEDKLIALGNVKAFTESLNAFGDKMIYLKRKGKLYIIGNGHVVEGEGSEANEVFGSTIVHFFNEKRTVVVGNVRAVVYQEEE